ncbi:MAG: FecR domain-containing protein [Polyangiaceae bacterium]
MQEWIAAPQRSSLPLRFSDGTSIEVRPTSRVRVVDTSRDGARIAIERGELHAEVVPRRGGSWWVIAGPFAVHVTGTSFDVRWDPSSERFVTSVSHGSVVVNGPMVGGARAIPAGFRLAADLSSSRLEMTRLESSVGVPPMEANSRAFEHDDASVPGARAAETSIGSVESLESRASSGLPSSNDVSEPRASSGLPSSNDVSEPRASRRVIAEDSPAPTWQSLAKEGKLREAFVMAESQGFSLQCESSSAAELLLLGDAARLSGRPERATEALVGLRQRFPTDNRRAAAAFVLGKIAFDQRRAYSEAANWFSTSIREQPSGSLAREASGRLIEALRNSGDVVGARRAAENYLSKYPDGPHASVARALTK